MSEPSPDRAGTPGAPPATVKPPTASMRVRGTAALRVVAVKTGAWILIGSVVMNLLPAARTIALLCGLLGVVVLAIGVVASSASPTIRGSAPVFTAPVRGRWVATASPKPIAPSLGTPGFGTAHALVLAFDPDPIHRPRPLFGNSESGVLPPTRFPGFGQPVLSMTSGTVIRVHAERRDHRSRLRWAARIWQSSGEALLRFLGPVSRTIGNHVLIERETGGFVLYAHLKQHSIGVVPGDRVAVGDAIGSCGSSGACAEPQLLVQFQDRAEQLRATGLPWTLQPLDDGAGPTLPARGEYLDLPADEDHSPADDRATR